MDTPREGMERSPRWKPGLSEAGAGTTEADLTGPGAPESGAGVSGQTGTEATGTGPTGPGPTGPVAKGIRPLRTLILTLLLLVAGLPPAEALAEGAGGRPDDGALDALVAGPSRLLGVDPLLVRAMAEVESSSNPWCVTVNGRDHQARSRAEALALAQRHLARGASVDLGLMQINSWWLRRLRLSPATVLDPAANVLLGLHILRLEMGRHGRTWKAVGAYHSPKPARRRAYARKVARAYLALLEEGARAAVPRAKPDAAAGKRAESGRSGR